MFSRVQQNQHHSAAQRPIGRNYRRVRKALPVSVHVGNMHGSAIQQGSDHSSITINFDAKSDFRALIQDIKAKISALGLETARKQELDSRLDRFQRPRQPRAPNADHQVQVLAAPRAGNRSFNNPSHPA
jgi:hypothetical protein